jgi:CBS domain containing-hemolysin-like protein
LAGFVLYRCGHVPEVGESFVWRGWRFEVVDLDGRRIDKILASPVAD